MSFAALPEHRPRFICLGQTLFETGLSFGNWQGHMLAYFQGYILLKGGTRAGPPALRQLVQLSVTTGKTLICSELDPDAAAELRLELQRCRRGLLVIQQRRRHKPVIVDAIDGGSLGELMEPDVTAVLFIPVQGLRTFFALQREQNRRRLSLLPGCLALQRVSVVGIAPARSLHARTINERLNAANLLVTFPFVMELLDHNAIQTRIELIPYDWNSYTNNIRTVHKHLLHLHCRGVYDVTLVVEGNPEMYDLLPYIQAPGRSFCYEGILPAVVICADALGRRYRLDLSAPGYTVISGYGARHDQTVSTFQRQLRASLDTALTCFVIELYSGDMSPVLRAVQACRRRKCLLALNDIFTDKETVYAIDAQNQVYLSWLQQRKGLFTSLAIVDEAHLLRSSSSYERLLREHSPFGLRSGEAVAVA